GQLRGSARKSKTVLGLAARSNVFVIDLTSVFCIEYLLIIHFILFIWLQSKRQFFLKSDSGWEPLSELIKRDMPLPGIFLGQNHRTRKSMNSSSTIFMS